MVNSALMFVRSNLYILFQVICLNWLTQRRWSVRRTALILAVYVVVQATYHWFMLTVVQVPQYSVYYHPFVKMPLCVILSVIISKYRGTRALFTGLTTIALMYFVDTISSTLSPFCTAFGIISMESAIYNLVIKSVIYLLLLLLVRFFLSRSFLSLQEVLPKYWGEFCIIPCAFILLMTSIFLPMAGETFHSKAFLNFLVFSIFIIFYYIIWKLVQTVQSIKIAEHDRQLLATQVEALHTHEQEVQSLYNSLRIYRHDLRHYISMITDALQKNQDTEECLAMLNHLYELVQSSSLSTSTADFNASSLLTRYTQWAQERGIQVEAQFDMPSELSVNKYELLVAIGNALENAVQASAQVEPPERRLIRLSGRPCGNQYLFEISNTYQTTPRFDPVSHLPVTDDPDHGLGTRSIWAFAQKYGGVAEYDLFEDMFRLRLLFTPTKKEDAAP